MRRRNVVVLLVLAGVLLVGIPLACIGGSFVLCPLVEDPDVCDRLPMCSTLQLRYEKHCDYECESRLAD